ncbi:MAG: hypothetical protein HND47_14180 [Chloroflexi bacterium]|nr:hypothetical protein [Chloroflexota bacterium]
MTKANSEDRTKIIIAVISAIAVIAAAVIGAAWGDIRSWLSEGKDMARLGGVWRGDFTLTNGESYNMTVTLGGNCMLGKVCGTFQIDIPNTMPCTADITIVSVKDKRYVFEAGNMSTSCIAVDYQYFELVDDNSLIYEVGEGVSMGRGVLRKLP